MRSVAMSVPLGVCTKTTCDQHTMSMQAIKLRTHKHMPLLCSPASTDSQAANGKGHENGIHLTDGIHEQQMTHLQQMPHASHYLRSPCKHARNCNGEKRWSTAAACRDLPGLCMHLICQYRLTFNAYNQHNSIMMQHRTLWFRYYEPTLMICWWFPNSYC